MNCNQGIESEKLKKSNLYAELIESNERLLKSNAEINTKIDKLYSIINDQEKKLQKKDEKLISLIISQMYPHKSTENNDINIVNSILKKFKTIIPSKSEQ
ncbi:hypothetical protein [Clostridium hydrogenum]|uniref:hypothetical protein n=1 Tax=Clostridium hydrogenum TaxID=2855764 RepID=UPI001F18AECC|nr:hypothetical protein [Clostridium hydrogenum]